MINKVAHDIKILAVEDDAGDFGLIKAHLRLAGYGLHQTLSWVSTLAEAKKHAEQNKPSIILLDLSLPDSSGVATVIAMRAILPNTPIIVLSGNDDKQAAVTALEEGAQDYIVKGEFDQHSLDKTISHALIRSKLEDRLRLFEAALNAAANAIVITDKNRHIQWVNPAFTQLTGYELDELIGQKPGELIQSDRHDQAFYENLWGTLLSGNTWRGELTNQRKNGELYEEDLTISSVMDAEHEISNFVAIKSDISERKKMERQIRQLAFYDTLTHLPNRRLLNDRLSQAMSTNKRRGFFGALMFLDLDNFKSLNDSQGHGVGDLLLIEAAKRLKSCIREMDTVARFGGDEFVVMLNELDQDKVASTSQAQLVAEKILNRLSAPYLLTVNHDKQPDLMVEHHCTASIGVVMFAHDQENQADVLKWADDAMYQAKDAGRNQICFHQEL
ncbi:MAG: diguanylate cyclase [Mariprofundus sp.]|nr:diguanylate cyclase [Mariprofundus sp.]